MLGWFFSSHPVFVSFPFLNEMTDSSPVFEKEIGANQEVSLNYCCFVNFRNRIYLLCLFFECQEPKFPKGKLTKPKKTECLPGHP